MILQYETLRLYGPIVFIPKYTNAASQNLVINDKEHTIPPGTYVIINSVALHTLPRYWGSDSLVWRPDRWIKSPTSSSDLASEELFQPPAGTYVPWAHGPRVCPGKKFSQVEFVAVIASLLKSHRVRPTSLDGESQVTASQRILEVLEDSGVDITFKMRHPERIRLKWSDRK